MRTSIDREISHVKRRNENCQLQRHATISQKTLYWIKEASYKSIQTLWFKSYENTCLLGSTNFMYRDRSRDWYGVQKKFVQLFNILYLDYGNTLKMVYFAVCNLHLNSIFFFPKRLLENQEKKKISSTW